MISELEDLPEEVRPENKRRVKYFCGMLKKLKLISIYSNLLGFFVEDNEEDEVYESLDRLRITWRNQEIKRIKENLEQTQYRLRGVEAVGIVTNGRRMEQVRTHVVRHEGGYLTTTQSVHHVSYLPASPASHQDS